MIILIRVRTCETCTLFSFADHQLTAIPAHPFGIGFANASHLLTHCSSYLLHFKEPKTHRQSSQCISVSVSSSPPLSDKLETGLLSGNSVLSQAQSPTSDIVRIRSLNITALFATLTSLPATAGLPVPGFIISMGVEMLSTVAVRLHH